MVICHIYQAEDAVLRLEATYTELESGVSPSPHQIGVAEKRLLDARANRDRLIRKHQKHLDSTSDHERSSGESREAPAKRVASEVWSTGNVRKDHEAEGKGQNTNSRLIRR